ncbi:protein CHROMATIN REMODELING 20 isoform X3 [Cucumis melo var. makuwa]|uniref:Protein CHROMATIN REMODELING 20 isoform X3 n=1 Tax=Cucumis melo var. makuwa TaxID=1194695 RepID=A0A5D3BJY9_CUCMM|nr:protein CHROMATIN REMODELING 20 isoform X3 [Cucumis melo var. makuwa]TYJ98685.1 protein CHROMATIN REMODELING 20 isoform X3 [Cucumis melo var. makuwa]
MEEKHEDVDDVGSASGDSFIDDSEDDGPSTSGKDDQLHLEASDISFFICIYLVLALLVASCLASQ